MPDILHDIQTQLDNPRLREQLPRLFCETLNWGRGQGATRLIHVNAPIPHILTVQPVAKLGGLPVLRADWKGDDLPNLTQRRAVYKALAPTHLEHLLCYLTADGKQAAFVWARERDKQAEFRTLPYEQGTPARTTIERLSALAFDHSELVAGEPPVSAVTDRLNAAFDVEAVAKRFFTEYAAVFREVEESVKGVPKDDRRRLYTQRLFNRLMFLYFIQRKGWLFFQGDKNYLRALFNKASAANEDFLNARLYWTFFYGLNTAGEDYAVHSDARLRERRGDVPFLNGGLFDLEDEYDVREKVNIPNDAFAAIFDLFDRYNFTVTESTPLDIEVAVDPEMLGKVFEELVTGRHETGSYYTPRAIVAFMCRESLKQYLLQVVNDEAAVARFVDEGDPAKLPDPESVLNALKNVKVCDPACGSGAYLLGMMQELLRLREALFVTHRLDARNVYDRKLETIQNNLYGVDIDLFAVNIAKLRLWLSLSVDFEGAKPPPLPNLDFKIECGDSLTAPHPQGLPDLFRRLLVESADRLADLKGKFLRTYGADKKKLAARIKEHESKLRENLQEQLDPGAVDWRVAFAEAFKSGGFDIVLANPPYGLLNKRQNQKFGHTISPKTVQVLKASEEYKPVLRGMVNVCSLFIRRSFSLLRPKGVLVEIFPLAFACDWSYALLRAYVFGNHILRSIDAFPERDDTHRRVFASAKMSVCIMLATCGVSEKQHPFGLRIHHQPFIDPTTPVTMIQPRDLRQFDINCSIPLVTQRDIDRLKTIYTHSVRVRDVGRCYTGEIDLTQARKFLRDDARYAVMYKGAIIDRYKIRETMSQGEIEYVDKAAFLKARGGRSDSNAWHHKKTRIVLQGITGINERIRLKMTLIPPGTFLANSANYILLGASADEEEYLFTLAVMNSETANYVFKCFSTNSNVNGYEVDNLPIPRPSAKEKHCLAALANTCLKLYAARRDEKGRTDDIARAESEINKRVAALYGLI